MPPAFVYAMRVTEVVGPPSFVLETAVLLLLTPYQLSGEVLVLLELRVGLRFGSYTRTRGW